MNAPNIRQLVVHRLETRSEMGRNTEPPRVRVVAAAVVANPYAGRYVADLSPVVDTSADLGTLLAQEALRVLDAPATSYGKAALVGTAGEQEHGVMFITTPFGDALRGAVGGGDAWISSVSGVGPAGTALTIPLAHKDALYVRDHYDAVPLTILDAPLPDEVVVAVALADRGRPNNRLGGLAASDIAVRDGLR